jgi:hypothetical protein
LKKHALSIDGGLLREIEASGFVKRLYGEQAK